MELLLELILQIVGEIFFQGLIELGWRGLSSPFQRNATFHPAFSFIIYLSLGAISGAITLWLFPNAVIASPNARLIHLAIAPILLGFAFELLGRRREKKGRERLVLDRFSYGFVFAFAYGLVRYFYAR